MHLSFGLVALLLATLSTANAQDDARLGRVRRAKKTGKKSKKAPESSLQPLPDSKSRATSDEIQRVVVKCKAGQGQEECLSDIKASAPEGNVKVIHKLKKAKAYAVSIKSDNLKNQIGARGFDLYDDPVRKPLHIEESIQVHRDLQSSSQSTPYGIDMVNAPSVWEQFGARGSGVKVCVLDTGLAAGHSDLTSSKLSGYSGNEAVTPWDRDQSGHGTHVTGTIAAADNSRGVVGVAPDVEVYTVRVFDNRGFFFGSDVVAAAEACRDAGVDIISMSLGGPSYDQDELEIFEELYEQGIISIAASGNSGDTDYSFPASYEVVISVAAVNSNRNVASFSTRNNRVDVAAPGVNIRSTWNNGRYASISGTSMATPHVSGVIALMRSYKPSASPDEIVNALIATAENPNTSGRDNSYGHGVVDALAAVGQLGDIPGNPEDPEDPEIPENPPNNPDCIAGETDFELTLNTDGYGSETTWLLRDSSGKTVASGDGYSNNQSYVTQRCLPRGCYTFTIYDSYGDGLCCNGNGSEGYTIRINGEVFASGRSFGDEEIIPDIGNCQPEGPSCVDIEARVVTDRYGYETSHFLRSSDGTYFWRYNRLGRNREYIDSACVDPSGCYRYQINDSYGDGISGEGVTLKYDGEVLYTGGDFGYGGFLDLGAGC